MKRRGFLGALAAAPLAICAWFKARPKVDAASLSVTLRLDTSELDAAINKIQGTIEGVTANSRALTPEEVRELCSAEIKYSVDGNNWQSIRPLGA